MQGDGAVTVILSGNEKLAEIVRSEPQVQRRFSTLNLPRVGAQLIMMIFLPSLRRIAHGPVLRRRQVRIWLIGWSMQRDTVLAAASNTARSRWNALLGGADELRLDHFAAACAIQEGESIARNVFLADDWREIDADGQRETAVKDGFRARRGRDDQGQAFPLGALCGRSRTRCGPSSSRPNP